MTSAPSAQVLAYPMITSKMTFLYEDGGKGTAYLKSLLFVGCQLRAFFF
jgi:hypothetical protein